MHDTRQIVVGLLEYPGAMQSAVLGLIDVFQFANRIISQYPQAGLPTFAISRWRTDGPLVESGNAATVPPVKLVPLLDVLIIPPSIGGTYYEAPHWVLVDWLKAQHARGTIVCSACAGSFVLAATGLLDGRRATTHWDLSSQFAQRFPNIHLNTDHILINDGDVVTAGGLMSWMDLGLELVEQFTCPTVMIELGKFLIIDTGRREQRYYKKFVPSFGHGNAVVLKAQHYIQQHFHTDLTVKMLAEHSHLGERTLLRKFISVTGLKPSEYVQKIRIQKARELLETTNLPIEKVALVVGYEDAGAFRKIFKRLTGLSPREFRVRFSV
jgi:transcriptional regulator GlxA family with amidase domain